MIIGSPESEKQVRSLWRAQDWEAIDPERRVIVCVHGPATHVGNRDKVWRQAMAAEAEGKLVVIVYPNGELSRLQKSLLDA